MDLVRIIARRDVWPDLKTRPNRDGLRLRWSAHTEDGELLVAATEHPLEDAAFILRTQHGLPGDTPVTLRHSGAEHDAFRPVALSIPAARGAKRVEERDRLVAGRTGLWKDRAGVSPYEDMPPKADDEAPLSRHEHEAPGPAARVKYGSAGY
jgi:hypothetical protein